MNALWQQWSARFDALSLRERIAVFGAIAAVLVFVANALVIEPQSVRGKILARQIADQTALLASLGSQMKALQLAQANDPDVVNRERIKRAQGQLSELEAQFAANQKSLVPADRMARVMQDVLRQHQGLQLVELRTLNPVPLIQRPAAKPATPDKAAEVTPAPSTVQTPAAMTETNLYKHGFEITLRGNYPDFVQYLAQLERLPAHMYWGKVTLNADDYPRVLLTISVNTLSLDKAWLVL